jgi:nitrogen fixation protein FixH
MNFHWGKKVAALYIGFVLIVIGMVIFAMTKSTELVSSNYYEKEIKYQDQIDKVKKTAELSEQVKIENTGVFLLIKYPPTYNLKDIKGNILFYRPSDEVKDFKLDLALDEGGMQKVVTNKFAKGIWKVQINWRMNGIEYYNESVVRIE